MRISSTKRAYRVDQVRPLRYTNYREKEKTLNNQKIRIIELFAGVGGFRLGLEGHQNKKWGFPKSKTFKTVWANQWEPPGTDSKQFAFKCYKERFDPGDKHPETLSNIDIAEAIEADTLGTSAIPDCDMIVGGFPCQDYSVAKTLSQAGGIQGKKGVLWWQIYKLAELKQPKYLLLENVDRLLKSPANQRGRDFAIMLSCLSELGYSVEWRVINAAEYGFPQKRKRVYIFAEKTTENWDLNEQLCSAGIFAEAFPIKSNISRIQEFVLPINPSTVSDTFGVGFKVSPFQDAGIMQNNRVYTAKVHANYEGPFATLGDILSSPDEVPDEFYISEDKLGQWEYLKGSKKIPRIDKKTGHEYVYSEGSMAYPDSLDKPARTILTGEGGKTPSRFKHIIKDNEGKWRRLVPDELDQIQGFPKGWTNTGMSDGHRAFCMGNALVVGIPHRIGKVIERRLNS